MQWRSVLKVEIVERSSNELTTRNAHDADRLGDCDLFHASLPPTYLSLSVFLARIALGGARAGIGVAIAWSALERLTGRIIAASTGYCCEPVAPIPRWTLHKQSEPSESLVED